MNRWIWFCICTLLGLALVVGGLLIPAHLQAVESSVLAEAGRGTPGLTDQGLRMAYERNLGAARMLLTAAQTLELPGRDKLESAVAAVGVEDMPRPTHGTSGGSTTEPFLETVLRSEYRQKVLELLQASPQPAVQSLLQFRARTNTAIFSPSGSSAGQALDATIALSALLIEEGAVTDRFKQALLALASEANQGGDSQRFEQALLDLMSLGQRFNWGELTVFVRRIEDLETLRLLAELVRKADTQLPIVFAAVDLSGNPAGVAKYLTTFSQTGLNDLRSSLRFGAGGVNELFQRNQRLKESSFPRQLAVGFSLRMPGLALTVKWILYLAGGFLFAAALHFARRPASGLERPLQVRGFHVVRETLFALGFLLVVVMLSEPFLAQSSQKVDVPFKLRLSMVGDAVRAGASSANTSSSFMNQSSVLTLVLFFVIQALIYIACLVKLAEIRRQRVGPRIKLKLLDNEEHLFDAGIYLGFVGTVISLILVSLGIIKFGLMAAYSSTSFGIIFVSVFKIFNLRPLRRKLLLEAEVMSPEAAAHAVTSTAATSL